MKLLLYGNYEITEIKEDIGYLLRYVKTVDINKDKYRIEITRQDILKFGKHYFKIMIQIQVNELMIEEGYDKNSNG
ncbi:hypothetical protein [uncultured Clostridium sp.]|uniref:hypothetical protein n=1 Tax=uncultured Clostridium sp. TaxID=59620 RepID=UPI0026098D3C|nr:hypothetical protein [uncultured Clostridium sp.]